MKFALAALLVTWVGALSSAGSAARAEERTVVVPKGEAPFQVSESEVVRLIGNGISGSKFELKLTGPAKLQTTSLVRQLNNGQPLLGAMVKEFDIAPTGKGKVTATITVTPPQPDAKPKVTRFEFEVQ